MAELNCDAKVMKWIAKILNNQSQVKEKENHMLQVSDITQVIYMASLIFGNPA